MAQQINLFTPILLTKRKYFSAVTMLWTLALFVLAGGSLMTFCLSTASSSMVVTKAELAARTAEKQKLQQALQSSSAGAGSAQQGVVQELKQAKLQLAQKRQLLVELRRGLVTDDNGHAARLQLIAQTIPASAWITELSSDDQRLELRGLTTEPSSLNGWIARLSQSPLLQGQALAALRVEQAATDAARPGAAAAATPASAPSGPPTWVFNLKSAAATPQTPASGARP